MVTLQNERQKKKDNRHCGTATGQLRPGSDDTTRMTGHENLSGRPVGEKEASKAGAMDRREVRKEEKRREEGRKASGMFPALLQRSGMAVAAVAAPQRIALHRPLTDDRETDRSIIVM